MQPSVFRVARSATMSAPAPPDRSFPTGSTLPTYGNRSPAQIPPDEGGKTKYTARVLHWTVADREAHEKMGFHQGWGQCADSLWRS
jgi:uncharacterized protein YndB with AHSA1/START domain